MFSQFYYLKSNIKKLREKLGRIVSPQNAENWWKPDLFEKNTLHKLPPGLKVVTPPPVLEKNYNCFVYVLGLEKNSRFIGSKAWEHTRYLGDLFEKMIRQGYLQERPCASKNVLVLYRDSGGRISHVGVMKEDERVVSKWSLGPLLEHNIWSVPDHYGDDVSFWVIKEGAVDFVKRNLFRGLD